MKLRWIAVPFAFAAALASAHIYWTTRGVHFKADSATVDFGLPPSRFGNRVSDLPMYTVWRPGTKYLGGDYSYWEEDPNGWISPEERAEENRAKELIAAYELGRKREIRDDRPAALAHYRAMLRRGQGDVAFLRGRIDLYKEVGRGPVRGLSDYLAATSWRSRLRTPLPKNPDPKLAPFVEYEAASVANLNVEPLLRVAHRYPDSSRAPASLIMAARALTQGEREIYAKADLNRADTILKTLLKRYPRSRFTWSARGGLGRIAFLRKDYAGAIRHYEAQMRTADGGAQKRIAAGSILLCTTALGRKDAVAASLIQLFPHAKDRMFYVERLVTVLKEFDAADARRLGDRLRRDPELLRDYLEFRLDFTEPTRDLFALGKVRGVSGLPLARIAAAALKLRDAQRANGFARRALALKDERDSHAMATFVLASIDRRAGRLRAARERYASLLRRWPKSYLVGGARENLALLEERFGNLATAFDHYTSLNYHDDIAYMADIRMSPRQLESYIRSRPQHPRKKDLIYTLGMRYLRVGQWSNAERAFAKLTTKERRTLTGTDSFEGGLQDPLATLRALRRLEGQVRSAPNRQTKAEAIYATGQYYYRHRQLLLYSAPAWGFQRNAAISYSWNQSVAQPEDDRALDRHHLEHEALAHALRHFRRVVKEFPETPTASKAAYWGACAAERLSNFNPYWRWHDRDASLSGEAAKLMRLAQRSDDPGLAKRARKYTPVFRDQYARERLAIAQMKPIPRRYGVWRSSND